MNAPWPVHHVSIDDDSGRAQVKKERERKKAGGYFNAGPGYLLRHLIAHESKS